MSRSKSPSSSESSPSSYTPGAASVAPDQDSHEGDTPSPSGSMASTLSTVSNVSRKVKRARSTATQPIPKKSMQIKTDKPRPHVCTVCTRAFARLEHLKRHERLHTNEKPFQCACCGRCFARRDLVLRHQQKLHSSIPSIMRRGLGTKDVDAYASEFIIVLSDNTSANAPLPGSVPLQGPNSAPADSSAGVGSAPTPSAGSLSSMGPTGRNASNSTQSPSSIDLTKNILGNYKKNTSSASTSVSTDESALFSPKTEPQFRTAMFLALQTTGLPEDDSSPRKQMKKPHSVASVRMSHDHTRFVPTLPTSAPTSFTPLPFAYSNSRHLSFSAASGTSYTNLKDAMGDDHAPFASPKLEWNLDHLDLSARKSPSMRNLLQFFTQDSILTQPPNSDGAMAAFLFHNPEHPHHLKGMTPFEFDENDNLLALQQMQNHEVSHESSSQVDELSKKRKREPFPRIKLEKNASFTSLPLLLGNDDEWLREILAVPMEKNFPAPSHQVGFNEETAQNVQNVLSVQNGGLNNQNSLNGLHTRSGLNQQLHVDVIGGQTGGPTGQILNSFESPNGPNISSLFKSRQISLVQHLNPSLNSLSDFEFHFDNSPSALLNYNFILPHLRLQIVRMSGLQDDKIPPCEDLNNYLRLYELDFNKYFPFVHLPSLKHPMADNFENIPLLLLMALIGALYLYHDTNTVLLFNLSKFHIQSFFEKEITLDNLQFKKVPLMALQCLVLHIFILMFLNEVNMVDVTSRQIKLMIGLIKLTNFHEPLEMFLNPPEPRAENSGGLVLSLSLGQALALAQQNFDYFILAQLRIRTLHVFYMLQVFRSSVFGTPIHFDSSQLKSGNHCCDEELWHCESATEWSARSASMSDIPPNIVSISNDKSFTSMISMLENTTYTKLSFNNMLALLMYIHEQTQFAKPASPSFSYVDWQLNHVPRLERLVKSWETLFCRAGGILSLGGSITHNEFKLLLPLHSLVRIKLIVNLDPIMSAVVMQNWPQMNRELARLSAHETELQLMRQCIPFCVDLIELWNCNVEAIDPKQISLRSPVFFVTCLFVSVLLMLSYLRHLEGQQPILQPRLPLSQLEAIIWTTIEKALLKVESVLRTILLSSYSENLTANGTFSLIAAGHNSGVVSRLLLDGDLSQVQAEIVSAKLSVKCLYLGVRILADAPVWPIAMGFAEGLKNRAMV